MRIWNVYNAGTDTNPNANDDPTTEPNPTQNLNLTLGFIHICP